MDTSHWIVCWIGWKFAWFSTSSSYVHALRYKPWAIDTACVIKEFVFTTWRICKFIRHDPRLPDDSGEMPKIECSGWRFGFRSWRLLYLTKNKVARWPCTFFVPKNWIKIHAFCLYFHLAMIMACGKCRLFRTQNLVTRETWARWHKWSRS